MQGVDSWCKARKAEKGEGARKLMILAAMVLAVAAPAFAQTFQYQFQS